MDMAGKSPQKIICQPSRSVFRRGFPFGVADLEQPAPLGVFVFCKILVRQLPEMYHFALRALYHILFVFSGGNVDFSYIIAVSESLNLRIVAVFFQFVHRLWG